MSATVAAVAAAASANAAAAAANSHRRAQFIAQCKEMMPRFDAANADAASAQWYASCVSYIYPSDDAVGRLVVLWLLLSLAAGGLFYWIFRRDSYMGPVEGTLFYGFGGLLSGAGIGLVIAAIMFVTGLL